MEISEERHGDVVVLRVQGRLSVEFPELWDRVISRVGDGCRLFAVDVTNSIWMNSQSFIWFRRLRDKLVPIGARIAVVDEVRGAGELAADREEYMDLFGCLDNALEFLAD